MALKDLTPEQWKKYQELDSQGVDVIKEYLYENSPLFKHIPEQGRARAMDKVVSTILLNYLISEELL